MAQKNRKRTDDAVSPVIGVILMVAITVILAAVIGTFVLGLGGQVQQNAQAGFTFDQSGSSPPTVTVTLSSKQRLDSWSATCSGDEDGTIDTGTTTVGDTNTIDCSSGETVTIVGTYQGSENVITTYEVK
ncbi:type IV pilin [Halorutilales archaeon Cl-col2-1]